MKTTLITAAFIAICVMSALSEEEEKKDTPKKETKYGTIIGIDLGTTYSW
jgi:hypothetical protein